MDFFSNWFWCKMLSWWYKCWIFLQLLRNLQFIYKEWCVFWKRLRPKMTWTNCTSDTVRPTPNWKFNKFKKKSACSLFFSYSIREYCSLYVFVRKVSIWSHTSQSFEKTCFNFFRVSVFCTSDTMVFLGHKFAI